VKKNAQGTLLVVDDNEMNRDMLSRRLQREGYNVLIAEDGYIALEMMKAQKFDLIILDVMMPGLNGFEMLPMIRQTHSLAELPVILATAKDRSDDIVEGLKLGANDYVTKPIDFPVLLARLRTHMQLQHLAQLKDEFLRIASHDLKNPLSSVMMSAHVAIDMVPPGTPMPEQIYQMLTFIVKRSEEMRKIISDFLDFQAMEDGNLTLEPKPLNLNEMARRVVESNTDYANSKKISVEADLDQGLPEISGDESRLEQVAQNLVSNAIKFGASGDKVVVRTGVQAGSAILEVVDSGPGLSEDDMNKAFVKYARLSNKPTGGEKSSGLGLAICKQMVELHGGRIGVRNNPARGATFWFSLPVPAAVTPPDQSAETPR
jgi:two-component system, sensor histidine kinase and response regulator